MASPIHILALHLGGCASTVVVNESNSGTVDMKVLVWACGWEERFAGPHFAREAIRQGYEVRVAGTRMNPKPFVEAFHAYKPDVVFCFAILAKLRRYYDMIRNHGAKLVMWYPDMTESRRDNMWRNKLNDVADVLIFSILETANRYRNLAPTVLWMPQYFDQQRCMRNGCLPQRLGPTKSMYDVVFIGSADRLRKDWLLALQRRYLCRFVVHGIGHGQLNECRGWAMAEAYAQSRIAINIQREMFINPGPFVTSNRAYNAMGSGAMFINHSVQRLELLWREGVHCVTHNDTLTDLCDKIDYYLDHEEERERIALAGQNNILTFHTLEQRIKEYWQVMEMLHNGRTSELSTNFPGYGAWVV